MRVRNGTSAYLVSSCKSCSSCLFLLLFLLWLALFIARMTAPSDLMDNDQERPAAYVMDCAVNGHWSCQRDSSGEVMSKPPLYTWLAALFTLAAGRASLWALYLPGALAVLGTVWLLFAFGEKLFGRGAGFWAALGYLLSITTYKQLALARTDPVFTFTVFASALLAFRAWREGRGWAWFWLAAAAATLAKGPLGVLFAAGGLLAALWEKKTHATGERDEAPRASLVLHWGQLAGVALFFAVTGGWFFAAWFREGKDFIDKIILRELFGHALDSPDTEFKWWRFSEPFLYFLSRFAPWSLLACAGFRRAIRKPAPDTPARSFERFLACYFFFGLILLSAASHKRADLNFPLLPAAALLAGREIARWIETRRPARLIPVAAGVVVVAIAALGVYSHVIRARDPKVLLTAQVREFADSLRAEAGENFQLEYLDAPYALQFFLNTMRRNVSFETARDLLTAPAPAYVVAKNLDRFEKSTGLTTATLHAPARCPESGKPFLVVLGNRARFEPPRTP